jgi:cobalt-precorrin 5A hydrolase
VLKAYTADELMSVTGVFTHSDFVEKTTGADNVCERAAVCAGGRIIIPKTAQNGVTAAVAEMPVFIDFERKDA